MITVITGPHCSGKSTYVRQHRLPGDITIDFDAIAQTLSDGGSHDHSERVREVTAAAWFSAIRELTTRSHARQRAWIIDARPSAHRYGLYDRAGARFVTLTAEPAELHRRADDSGRPVSDRRRIDEFMAESNDPQPRTVTRW